ncbi:MAG: DEAD/DEAH box helicase [Myxococcota bacterium]|nr:DEAD/DEAH box helicase [Myxococcota bacterium]
MDATNDGSSNVESLLSEWPICWRCLSAPVASLIEALGERASSLLVGEGNSGSAAALPSVVDHGGSHGSLFHIRRTYEALLDSFETRVPAKSSAQLEQYEILCKLLFLSRIPLEKKAQLWPRSQAAYEWDLAPTSAEASFSFQRKNWHHEEWSRLLAMAPGVELFVRTAVLGNTGGSVLVGAVLRAAERVLDARNQRPAGPHELWRCRQLLMEAEDALMERLLALEIDSGGVDFALVTAESVNCRPFVIYSATDGGLVMQCTAAELPLAGVGSGYAATRGCVRRFNVYERIARSPEGTLDEMLYVSPEERPHFESLLSAEVRRVAYDSTRFVTVEVGNQLAILSSGFSGWPRPEFLCDEQGQPVSVFMQAPSLTWLQPELASSSFGQQSIDIDVADGLRLVGRWRADENGLFMSLSFCKGACAIPLIRILNAWQRGKTTFGLGTSGRMMLPQEWLQQYGNPLDDLLRLQALHGETVPQKAIAPLRGLAALVGVPPEYLRQAPAADITLNFHTNHCTLREYQRMGVGWLQQRFLVGSGGILADDMGLGKTCQALVFMAWLKEAVPINKPMLVVCPTSVIGNWLEEAKRFVPTLTVSQYYGSRRQIDRAADVILTTYGIVRSDISKLCKNAWTCVILDEAQAIKNPTSKTSRACRRLKATARFALTGTPFENSLAEFWSISDFVAPGVFAKRPSFIRQFRSIEQAPGTESSNRKIAHLTRCIDPFLLRRLKEAVAQELPPKEVRYELCQMAPDQSEMYAALEANFRRKIGYRLAKDGFQKTRFAMFEAMMRLRQAACDPNIVPGYDGYQAGKRQCLRRLLTSAPGKNHRWLIFSQWTSLLAYVKLDLEDLGLDYLYLDGSTRDRLALQSAWNQPDGADVFLISLKAGGTGLNLTAADRVVLLDPWWNPAVEDQAMDRAYRIGQDKSVLVFKLIAAGTIEERVVRTQERKRGLFDSLINYGLPMAQEQTTVSALFGGSNLTQTSKGGSRVAASSLQRGPELPKFINELLVFHGVLTNQIVREALGCSAYAATKRLKQWTKDGLLMRKGRRKNTRYIASDDP